MVMTQRLGYPAEKVWRTLVVCGPDSKFEHVPAPNWQKEKCRSCTFFGTFCLLFWDAAGSQNTLQDALLRTQELGTQRIAGCNWQCNFAFWMTCRSMQPRTVSQTSRTWDAGSSLGHQPRPALSAFWPFCSPGIGTSAKPPVAQKVRGCCQPVYEREFGSR